jgi:hypothetical protein
MEGVEPNGTKVSARGTVERMSMDVPDKMTYVPFPESLDFSWGIMARVFAKLHQFLEFGIEKSIFVCIYLRDQDLCLPPIH